LHSATIGDGGLPARVAVRQDVGRLEQLSVPKPADRASLLIRPQHPLPKRLLMKPALGDYGHVCPPGFYDPAVLAGRRQRVLLIVHRDEEAQRRGLVADHVHRPDRHVLAGDHPEQVDQRESTLHGAAEAHVVRVARIGAPIAIPQSPLRIHLVCIGVDPSFLLGRGPDRERHLGQDRGFEDTGLAHEGDTAPSKVKALEQPGP
jgi:hypothetical protein